MKHTIDNFCIQKIKHIHIIYSFVEKIKYRQIVGAKLKSFCAYLKMGDFLYKIKN